MADLKIETELQPPGLPDFDDDGDDDSPSLYVSMTLTESDGTAREAHVFVPADLDDSAVVTAMLSVVDAVCGLRGPSLLAELRRRLNSEGASRG